MEEILANRTQTLADFTVGSAWNLLEFDPFKRVDPIHIPSRREGIRDDDYSDTYGQTGT
jgi:hypothetical protein